MTLFTIFFSIIAILTTIHFMRESYLSGFYSKNIIQTIGIVILVLLFIIYSIRKEQIDILMRANIVLAMITIGMILLLLLVPSKIGDYFLEKEKRRNFEKWNRWEIILSRTTWIQRGLFYYKVSKN